MMRGSASPNIINASAGGRAESRTRAGSARHVSLLTETSHVAGGQGRGTKRRGTPNPLRKPFLGPLPVSVVTDPSEDHAALGQAAGWDNWTPSRQVKPQLPGQLPLRCHAEAAPQPPTCAVLQSPSSGRSTVPGPQQLVAAQLCWGRVPVPSWHPQKQLSSAGSWVQALASSRSRYEAGRSPLEPRSCLVAGEVVASRIQDADACGVETVSASEIRSVGATVLYL